MATPRAPSEESAERRRSPRLARREEGLPIDWSAALGTVPRTSDDQRSVVVDVLGEVSQLPSQRHSIAPYDSRLSAGTAVIYPTLDEPWGGSGGQRSGIDDIFDPWRILSPEMRQRQGLLAGTFWCAFLKVKGSKILETWVIRNPGEFDGMTFCVDGTVERMTNAMILRRKDDYISMRTSLSEEILFLPEMLMNLKKYMTEVPLGELIKVWGESD